MSPSVYLFFIFILFKSNFSSFGVKPYVGQKIQVFMIHFVLSVLCFSFTANAPWARPWACPCLLEWGGVLSVHICTLPDCSLLPSLLSSIYPILSCLSSSSGNRTFPKLHVNLWVSSTIVWSSTLHFRSTLQPTTTQPLRLRHLSINQRQIPGLIDDTSIT